MRALAQTLSRLFKTASRVSARTGRGLLQHGTGKYAVNAVRNVNITVRGVRIVYHELNEFDKAVVDEVVEYATRFAYEYIDHHDENTRYRIAASSLDDVVMSHAREIMEAAEQALYSRLRSHGYDTVAGRPQRVAIFQDEDVLKQLIMAVAQEIGGHIDEVAS
ncbi:MAG TPA: hypothetical protein VHC19_20535 [Pirellulales bacterium]|nr:hypothetical protein [Pirellulales bacterium]